MALFEEAIFQFYRLWKGVRVYLLVGAMTALVGMGYYATPVDAGRKGWWSAWVLAALWVLAVSTKVRERLTKGALSPVRVVRSQIELGMLSVVGVYGAVQAAGGVLSPYYPVVFLMTALFVSFLPLWMAIFLIFASIGEELSMLVLQGDGTRMSFSFHALFIIGFASLNFLFTRLEILRVRLSGKRRVEEELAQIARDARDFRLVCAPSASGGLDLEREEEEARLSLCTVSEVRHSLYGVLDILRQGLQCHSCIVFWVDESGTELRLKEASTRADRLNAESFEIGEGFIGGVVGQRRPVRLNGIRNGLSGFGYYAEPVDIRALIAVPIQENEHVRGVLVADRLEDRPFGDADLGLMESAAAQIVRAVENERVFSQLQRSKSDQGKLYKASVSLSAARSEKEVLEAGLSALELLAPYDVAAITDYEPRGKRHRILMAAGEDSEELRDLTFGENQSLVSMAVKNKHYLPYKGAYDHRQQMVFTKQVKLKEMQSLIVLPFVVQDSAKGTLMLAARKPGMYHGGVRPLLEVLANQLGQSLENSRMYRALEEMATTDGLTGLKNHRMFQEELDQKVKLAERFGRPLSLLLMDVDHFKSVNDTHGHPAGDVVLRGVAAIIVRNRREIDTTARYGGEEFAVICPETDTAGAMKLADRIRKDVEVEEFRVEAGPLKVTISIGVATLPTHAVCKPAMIEQADQALYRAKEGGRNRVEVARPALRKVS